MTWADPSPARLAVVVLAALAVVFAACYLMARPALRQASKFVDRRALRSGGVF